MSKKYKSDLMAAIHEDAKAMYRAGAITKQAMRSFDEKCLIPSKTFTPEEIKALREREKLSQPIFAYYLNVSKTAVSEWERGTKKPSGSALRLLSIVERNGIHPNPHRLTCYE